MNILVRSENSQCLARRRSDPHAAGLRRPARRDPVRTAGQVAVLLACGMLTGGDLPSQEGERPAGTPPAIQEGSHATAALKALTAHELRRLLSDLDADTFAARDHAMQTLSALGMEAVPYLVEALGDASPERRLRAQWLLARYDSFESLAPHLLTAASLPQGAAARNLLRERCRRQLEFAGQFSNVERLFRSWGTDREKYAASVDSAVQDARTPAELSTVVHTVLELHHRAATFSTAVDRLNQLSVANDHRHSAGYLVMETLARGLKENRPELTGFATRYIESLESFAEALARRGVARQSIRDEVGSRAGWSQGAAGYLVELLEPASRPSQLLREHVALPPQLLQDGFFEGLRSPDAEVYAQGVGRVHIVDLLGSALRQWPAAPRDGPVGELKAQTIDAARGGRKAKALVYLEALELCRGLAAHGWELQSGLGRQLAQRLAAAARDAENHRGFHPASSVHQRLAGLVHRGIRPGHPAFPQEYLEQYLQGKPAALTDTQRRALERYVALLDRLRELRVDIDLPGAAGLVQAARPRAADDAESLAEILRRLDQFARTAASTPDRQECDSQLGAWGAELAARRRSEPGSPGS